MTADDRSSTLSLAPGLKQAFSDDVPVELAGCAGEPGQTSAIRISVFSEGAPVSRVRLELTSEADLFFFFEAEYSDADYAALRAAQDLSIDFAQFAPTLAEILAAARQADSGFALTFAAGPRPSLLIRQALKFKTVAVFELAFARGADALVRERIQARYDGARAEVASVRADLGTICAMLKIKNPSVLKQAGPTRK
jgi:hypothetical protein